MVSWSANILGSLDFPYPSQLAYKTIIHHMELSESNITEFVLVSHAELYI